MYNADFKSFTLSNVAGTLVVLAVVVQVVVSLMRLVNQRRRSEKAFEAFFSIKRHPLLGNLDQFTNDEEGFQHGEEVLKDVEYATQFWNGPFVCCLICFHPATVKAILSTQEPKDELTYGMVKPWLGDGLLLSKGSKWFRNRRLLTPGFHFDILKPYVQVFNECTHTMLDKWAKICDKGSLEMFEHVSLLTLDSLLKCIFSQDSHCQIMTEQHPYIKAVYQLTKMIDDRARFPPFYSDLIYHLSYSGYKWRKNTKIVHQYSKNVIEQRKEALRGEKGKRIDNSRKYIDFLDILLAAKDEDGKGLTDQEIRDEVDTFMFEGHDTTASGISWCLYNLAKNPEHQQKCREEIDEVLSGKEEDVIDWDDISKLNYLTLCIKESMRVHPPVPFIGRRLTKPLNVSELGVTIPAGEWIGVSFMALHTNRFVWDDPEKFDPLRFTAENSQIRSPYAYVPFSAGPRNCIGQNFAMNEMRVAVALILRRFELSLDESVPARRVTSLVMRAENGLRLFVKSRSDSHKNV
ncbi:ultra-long-chain fatty acid omega-hydroxylase-like [Ptychodera flava]|uniref:ultra-long-chain fatty acid omega-hydroxylase-like n=1 Tax=Ptychodera flava TaxID=63121 RepID=UPI00396AB055